jgi:hypothetical protein
MKTKRVGLWLCAMILLAAPTEVATAVDGVPSEQLPGTILLFGQNGMARVDENGITVVIPPSAVVAAPTQEAAQAAPTQATTGMPLPGVTLVEPQQNQQPAQLPQGEQQQSGQQEAGTSCSCYCPPCSS